jgi:hypothetical protein
MAVQRSLLPEIVPTQWDSGKPSAGSGFGRVRHLQSIDDLVNRPLLNRGTATTNATAVNANGNTQSSGIGTVQLQPMRYAEFTVKARVTFNVNSVGPAFVYVYRTLGDVPANGAPPNVGDVPVGGGSFMGGAATAGVNESGSFSFLDAGLSVSTKYRYYLAVEAPNGNVLNLVNNSQLLVMERS